MKKEVIKHSLKKAFKLSFGIMYWFVMSIFIFIGLATKGAVFAIVLTLLFAFGFWFMFKMSKVLRKFGRNKTEKVA